MSKEEIAVRAAATIVEGILKENDVLNNSNIASVVAVQTPNALTTHLEVYFTPKDKESISTDWVHLIPKVCLSLKNILTKDYHLASGMSEIAVITLEMYKVNIAFSTRHILNNLKGDNNGND